MKVATFEAVVENGQIRLSGSVRLPEKAKVYVVMPDPTQKFALREQIDDAQAKLRELLEGGGAVPAAYIGSPRLAHPEQAADFEKEVIEGDLDAEL